MSDLTLLGTEVPVSAIDKELKKLWEADDASTAASLMNLVIYSEQPGSLAANSEAARELTEEQACRAILVEIDRSIQEPSIRSFITAHCNLFGGKKSVCSEQVAFKMTGTINGRLRNTVFAHLNSDLPLILWWQGEFTAVLTERLLSVVNRLLINSADFADPKAAHQTLAGLLEATRERFVLQDLAWTRTYLFRLGFAQLFDAPAAEQALESITSLRVQSHTDQRVSGLLLISWVATQAGWKLVGGNGGNYEFSTKANTTVLVEHSSADDCAPIASLEVDAGETQISLTRAAGEKFIHQSLKSPAGVIDQLSPADSDTAVGLVGSQLSRGGKNRLYAKTLPLFRQLLEL